MKNIIQNHKQFVIAIFLAFLVMVYLCWLDLNPTFRDPDAFYHAKMGSLINEQGVVRNFPWMQFTRLKDHFADHHFLYHVALVPFIKMIGDPLWALKFANITFCTLAILTIYWVMRKFKITHALGFIILLLVTTPFVFRLSLDKAQPLALILLFLSFWALHIKNFKLLFTLSFLYVWTHGSWPLLLMTTVVWIFSDYLVKFFNSELQIGPWHIIKKNIKTTWQENKHFKILLTTVSGLVVGIIINPFFPNNLYFYWQQIVQVVLINHRDVIWVGMEWYPYGAATLLDHTSLIAIGAIFTVIVFAASIKKQPTESWVWTILTIAFIYLTLQSGRNVEFLVPLAVIWIANVWKIGFDLNLSREFSRILQNQMNKYQLLGRGIIIFIAFGSALIVIKDVKNLKYDLQNGIKFDCLKTVSEWLKSNTPTATTVLNDDWTSFPILFYYNSHNYYFDGLDPTFPYTYNRELYKKWVEIILGREKNNLAGTLKNDYRGQYILVTSGRNQLKDNLNNSVGIKQIYQDLAKENTVFEIE